MAHRLNVIIVPDEGGHSHRFQVSVIWLKAAAVMVGLFLISIIIAGVSYTAVARRAYEYTRLKSENARLEMENQRIIRVAREVDQSRRILAQIIRSLGGHLELETPMDAIDTTVFKKALEDSELDNSSADIYNPSSLSVERVMATSIPSVMPVDGFITQRFFQDHLFRERSHRGIDIAAKTGAVIKAATAGRVVFEGWTPYFGNCLFLYHANGYLTFYGHNHVNLKAISEEVNRGEPIALLGNTGHSSAPHLHFEIWKDGVPVDPLELLRVSSEARFNS